MLSISDGQDIHFRKAWFDHELCPSGCPRPCEKICPANAIKEIGGINVSSCYGCGRCLPVCPQGLIKETNHNLKIEDIVSLISKVKPDAIEIHTNFGRKNAFEKTVNELMKSEVKLKRIAVSCGLFKKNHSVENLAKEFWHRHVWLRNFDQKTIWQLDGRPMSGDLAPSTAKVAIKLLDQIQPLMPPGPIQLAGGTNEQTISYLSEHNDVAGIAFGGFARRLIQPWLIEAQHRDTNLRNWPEGWEKALEQAQLLIHPWLYRTETLRRIK